MYTKPTGWYGIRTYKASGFYKFFDNYRTLKLARKAALDFVKDYPGSKVVIEQDTTQGWIEREVYRG